MKIDNLIINSIERLELLSKKIVEGYLIGLHRSPFHGYSSEFREHKQYNIGDPIKSIDYKVYARTDKLFIKKYEEETNLNCYFILDNSSSMHYPLEEVKSKLDFSVIAISSLIHLLKKQRDAFGLITFNEKIEDIIEPKLTTKNKIMIYDKLLKCYNREYQNGVKSNINHCLTNTIPHIKKKSMVMIFSDFLESVLDENSLNEIIKKLQQLKFHKHNVIIFNIMDKNTELMFNFDNKPRQFVDVETGEIIKISNNNIKLEYQEKATKNLNKIKNKCIQNGIEFVDVDIANDYKKILETFIKSQRKK